MNEVVLVRAPGRTSRRTREVRRAVEELAAALEATGRTYRVTLYGSGDEGLVSPDRDATVLTIGMGPDAEDGIKDVLEVVERADAGPYEVTITGEFTADNDFLELSNKDLKEGELFFGLPAALIVLLVVFGAVVASLVPILLAIVAIIVRARARRARRADRGRSRSSSSTCSRGWASRSGSTTRSSSSPASARSGRAGSRSSRRSRRPAEPRAAPSSSAARRS